MATDIFTELANLFGALSRVFSDPRVKETGTKFLREINRSMDEQLDAIEEPERKGLPHG